MCISGDESGCEQLYQQVAPRVKLYLLRVGFSQSDADDLTQETFLRVYAKLADFDPNRGAFTQWVSAIAKNLARKRWANRAKNVEHDLDFAENIFADEYTTEPSADQQEQLALLDKAISKLEPLEASLVELRYKQGLTTRKIAQLTDMPESTVRLNLKKIISTLEASLKQVGITAWL